VGPSDKGGPPPSEAESPAIEARPVKVEVARRFRAAASAALVDASKDALPLGMGVRDPARLEIARSAERGAALI